MSVLNSMPHRCTIQRLVHSTGSLGGSKTTPTVEQTGVRCFEQSAGHAEVDEYQKRGMRVTSKVYFVADPQVTERHQILITERGGASVTEAPLDVKSEARPDASVGSGTIWKIMCDLSTGSDD